MRVVTKYIADDGIVFISKEACIQYENELKLNPYNKGVYLFDSSGLIISLHNHPQAVYMHITNSKIADALKYSVYFNNDHSFTSEIGYYVQSYENGRFVWQSVDEEWFKFCVHSVN